MNRKYRLEATDPETGEGDSLTFLAVDSMDATIDAIGVVLNRAFDDKGGLWARGEITLFGPDNDILQVMPAKGTTDA
jgi:hypothetical protein